MRARAGGKALLVGLLSLGCVALSYAYLRDVAHSKKADRVSAVEEEIRHLKLASLEWSELTELASLFGGLEGDAVLDALANTPMETVDKAIRVSIELRRSVFELWRLTGHCAFADIAPEALCEQGSAIRNRYAAVLGELHREPFPELIRAEMARNFALLQSDYWWPALAIIQEYIQFDRHVDVAGELRCVPLDAKLRGNLSHAMDAWFSDNKQSLGWNARLGQFTPTGGDGVYQLPPTVIDVFDLPHWPLP